MKKIISICLILVLSAMLMLVSNAAITEHSILPDDLDVSSVSGGTENPVTSGLNFSVNTSGKLTKVRLWIAEGRSGLHTVSIWDVDTGTKLEGPFDWNIEEGTSGWAYFTLPNAVDIEVGKSYGVVISDNVSTWMSAIHGYWSNNTPESDVFVTYHRGFSGAVDTLPTNWNTDGTYLVDVVFTTGEVDPEPTTAPTTKPATEPTTPPVTENPGTDDSLSMLFVIPLLIIVAVILVNVRQVYLAKEHM